MIHLLNHKQQNIFFDYLDDNSDFYPELFKLVHASDKKFVLSPYFMGGVETSLVEKLDIYVKGFVSFQPFYDFWNFMINDPHLIFKGINFFLDDIGSHNIDFLQQQVVDHFDPLYRASCCFLLNKVTKMGTITYGNLDKSFSRLTMSKLDMVKEFEYNKRFSVEMLNWDLVSKNESNRSVLMVLPHEIRRGLVDTGNNSAEKNILNFRKIRHYSSRSDNKIIMASTVTPGTAEYLKNKFDTMILNESKNGVRIIAHNV
tara:strand:+ start:13844 stop:14617 length:774 start_codon:yes stop_codon:yes gene_type:complete